MAPKKLSKSLMRLVQSVVDKLAPRMPGALMTLDALGCSTPDGRDPAVIQITLEETCGRVVRLTYRKNCDTVDVVIVSPSGEETADTRPVTDDVIGVVLDTV
jgi:hypothetical protein